MTGINDERLIALAKRLVRAATAEPDVEPDTQPLDAQLLERVEAELYGSASPNVEAVLAASIDDILRGR